MNYSQSVRGPGHHLRFDLRRKRSNRAEVRTAKTVIEAFLKTLILFNRD